MGIFSLTKDVFLPIIYTCQISCFNRNFNYKDDMIRQLEAICIYMKNNEKMLRVLIQCHADDDLADIFNRLDRSFTSQRIGSR